MNLDELRAERAKHRLTQKALADLIDITEISYNRKENGIREFSSKEIVKLSQVLELDIDSANRIFFDNKLTKCNI